MIFIYLFPDQRVHRPGYSQWINNQYCVQAHHHFCGYNGPSVPLKPVLQKLSWSYRVLQAILAAVCMLFLSGLIGLIDFTCCVYVIGLVLQVLQIQCAIPMYLKHQRCTALQHPNKIIKELIMHNFLNVHHILYFDTKVLLSIQNFIQCYFHTKPSAHF